MNRAVIVLSGLFVLQAGLGAALFLSGRGGYAFEASEPLIAFDAEAVTQIAITDGGGETATLGRVDDEWVLPALGDFPVDSGKVNRLLSRLADFKRTTPVSDRRASIDRFGVGDDGFERRISIETDDGAKSLYLGQSPSFKYVYARNGADDAVHTIAFAAHDAPTGASAWADPQAFHLSRDEIEEIRLGNITLQREGDAFVLAGLAADEKPKSAPINDLVEAVRALSFDSIEARAPDGVDFATPNATVSIKKIGGAARVYRFKAEPAEGDSPVRAYWFQSDEHAAAFRVGEYRITALLNADRDALIENEANDDDAPTPAEGATESAVGSEGVIGSTPRAVPDVVKDESGAL